ncbi:MAG: glycosyltransferase [Rhodobacteraceae bacterium]|nr:glycosyltransferase [Paracoccaceae bacterium]
MLHLRSEWDKQMPTALNDFRAIRFANQRKGHPGPYLVPLFSKMQRLKYATLAILWVLSISYFWAWWLQPEHVISTPRFVILSLALGWATFLECYFLTVLLRSRRPANRLGELFGSRVAMIVTKTPSEPFDIVRVTLEAMLAQDYPHDTWLADEDPSPETIAWCAERGVQISTRKDRQDYHRSEWPRRTRCKEGNLAFFYDHYGYEQYDFVIQMDADHVPQESYLREMLKPFADKEVGYVSGPSICASNRADSWAARTRLYRESMFHGVLQAGYSNGMAPMCIGSHYAVRTAALREVGGLGPELAEDHSTSMIMNAGGWRGVHSLDAIAIGAGPANITDMITQEFQWSRSLVTLLLRYTPTYFKRLRPALKFQFIFSQLWYPISALFMLVMYAAPIYAIVFTAPFAAVTYPAFIGHLLPAGLLFLIIAYVIKRDGFYRPNSAAFMSWEKALFPCLQWPWVFWGCAMAIFDSISGRFVDFRITPKGDSQKINLSWRVILPYFVLAIGALVPVFLAPNPQTIPGFFVLSIMNAALFGTIFLIIVWDYLRTTMLTDSINPIVAGKLAMAAVVLIAMMSSAIWMRGRDSIFALVSSPQVLGHF